MPRAKKATKKQLNAVRMALVEQFNLDVHYPDAKQLAAKLERDVHRGCDCPGQWSPGCLVCVHTEDGIPSACGDYWMQWADKVDAKVAEKGAPGIYHEIQNGAVVTFYEI